MNELLEQFLIEGRELVEQATGDLLALEARPADKGRLDSLFRAVHTLKGSAGIIDFAAMGRALHAAEDRLAEVRGAGEAVGPDMVGDCLTCLDQVIQWFDELEATGEPPADADAAADALSARFAGPESRPGSGRAGQGPWPPDAWLDAILADHPASRDRAATAIRYAPLPECFFQDEDPLAVLAATPGLLVIELAPAEAPWPELAQWDPHDCRLIVTALSSAPASLVAQALRPGFATLPAEVEIRSLAMAPAGDLSPLSRRLIDAQLRLLAVRGGDGLRGRVTSATHVAARVLDHAGRPDLAAEILSILAANNAAEAAAAIATTIEASLVNLAPAISGDGEAPAPRPMEARSLRVEVGRIDALIRLAGELTVVKNSIGHSARLARDGADAGGLAGRLIEQHATLDRLVGELRQSVFATRVLALRHTFQRFPRLVRELGAGLGKPVRLVTLGDETEADKTIVEGLFEPLLHVLRNAIDHGLEPPEERAALGKPNPAVVELRARRENDRVVVEVLDDGRGVDAERVGRVALARGLIAESALAALSRHEVIDLIFAPGFSTAANVTALSGRGVGLDAVRAAVTQLGGQVQVENRSDHGTVVRFVLPFTAMMTQLMTVEVGGQVFGVPLDAVLATARIGRGAIAAVGAAQAVVWRDRTIPLCSLAALLGLQSATADIAEAFIVLAQVGGEVVGLEVDRLGDRMDVMLTPMAGILSAMPGVAGTTLLGDGRVLIILDLGEIFA